MKRIPYVLRPIYDLTKEEEIQFLKDQISDAQDLIREKKKKLDILEDKIESRKLPKYSRYECIYCHKHRASRGVYHDGKLTGHICNSCDYEL